MPYPPHIYPVPDGTRGMVLGLSCGSCRTGERLSPSLPDDVTDLQHPRTGTDRLREAEGAYIAAVDPDAGEGVCRQLLDGDSSLRCLNHLRQGGTITVIEGDHGSVYFQPDSEAAR